MKKILLVSLMLGVAPVALADYRMTPREAVYYWASQGNVKNLKALQKSGYSLDMPDNNGRQAVCEAVDKNDVKAFKTLKKAGANMNVFCLYNMSQEKRYEFNQAYYGLPLVVPVMTESMLTEEVVQNPAYIADTNEIKNKPAQDILPVSEAIQFKQEAYEEPASETEDVEFEDIASDGQLKESVVFKPYVAVNLFYGKGKADLEASAAAKKSYHISDGVPGLALAFGTKIHDFRAELAVQGNTGFSKNIIDGAVKAKVQNYAGFFNLYYDIPTNTALTPYVGAGIGLAHNKATLNDSYVKYHNSNSSLAWQLAAGLNYALTDNWVADLGYRYTDYGKVNVVNENGVKYKVDDIRIHNVTLGLRYEM